jgi:hypothetical protein
VQQMDDPAVLIQTMDNQHVIQPIAGQIHQVEKKCFTNTIYFSTGIWLDNFNADPYWGDITGVNNAE